MVIDAAQLLLDYYITGSPVPYVSDAGLLADDTCGAVDMVKPKAETPRGAFDQGLLLI